MTCRFCMIVKREDTRDLLWEGRHVIAFEDAFPSARGHALVVPRRHVGHVRDLKPVEWRALATAAFELASSHDRDQTIGINDGPLAGQTIPHVHLHLIPRRQGDVPDPRGGTRRVLPSTAAYWEVPDATRL